ncbi:hypothetical protein Emed_002660 [Eimeria media]
MEALPIDDQHAGDSVVDAASATTIDTIIFQEILEGSVGPVHAGPDPRRLANGSHNPHEEQPPEPVPPSSDFADLCAELGEWVPMNPLPGLLMGTHGQGPLAAVQGRLAAVQGPLAAVQGPLAAVQGPLAAAQGPLAAAQGPLAAAQGPLAAVQGPLAAVQGPLAAAQGRLAAVQGPLAATQGPLAAAQGPIAPVSAASALIQASLMHAASGSQSFRGSGGKQRPPPPHPYVRLPKVQPGIPVPAFLPSRMRCFKSARRSPLALLRRVRELLLMEEIGKVEAEELVFLGEKIANHLLWKMSFDISDKKPFDAAHCLARRFMAFNTLVSISKAMNLGWQTESWWSQLAREVHTSYPLESLELPGVYPFNADLIRDMMHALELYKAGGSPNDALVVSIKQRLFSPERRRCLLGDACWAPWRDDDRDSSR